MAYLNRALTNLRAEINRRWPNRDKTSDGWIGDAAHQTRKSDHNPDPDGSVDAIDIDVDGINVTEVINAAIRHEATQYVIYNRRITSRNLDGGLGTWHPYNGSSPHTKHLHVSTRDSHEKSTKAWFPVITQEDTLSPEAEALIKTMASQMADVASRVNYMDGRIEAMTFGRDNVRENFKSVGEPVFVVDFLKSLLVKVSEVERRLATLEGKG